MKKIITLALVFMLALSLVACGDNNEDPPEGNDGEKVYKVAVLVPFIGDQSYFDSVNNGRLVVEEYPNVETTLIEMTEDKSKWEGYYLDACEGGYDLIIGGNMDAEEFLYGAAEQYPDQLFFNFDYNNHVDLPNVYAVTYSTSHLGYMAGVLATQVTKSGMDSANTDAVVGVIVGQDNAYMNDFIGSFCEVCTENDVRVIISYPDSFTDSAKAKELSLNMVNEGADVIWQVAGGAGTGVFEAAAESNIYSLGVDVDQVITMSGQPALAATILTSMTKNCDVAVQRAVDMLVAGTFPAGTTEVLGLKENGVGIANNEQYQTLVPQEIRDAVQQAMDRVVSGEVTPYSVLADEARWEEVKTAATTA